MCIEIVRKEDNNVKTPKNSSDDEDWKRLEKWHIGRANYP